MHPRIKGLLWDYLLLFCVPTTSLDLEMFDERIIIESGQVSEYRGHGSDEAEAEPC